MYIASLWLTSKERALIRRGRFASGMTLHCTRTKASLLESYHIADAYRQGFKDAKKVSRGRV